MSVTNNPNTPSIRPPSSDFSTQSNLSSSTSIISRIGLAVIQFLSQVYGFVCSMLNLRKNSSQEKANSPLVQVESQNSKPFIEQLPDKGINYQELCCEDQFPQSSNSIAFCNENSSKVIGNILNLKSKSEINPLWQRICLEPASIRLPENFSDQIIQFSALLNQIYPNESEKVLNIEKDLIQKMIQNLSPHQDIFTPNSSPFDCIFEAIGYLTDCPDLDKDKLEYLLSEIKETPLQANDICCGARFLLTQKNPALEPKNFQRFMDDFKKNIAHARELSLCLSAGGITPKKDSPYFGLAFLLATAGVPLSDNQRTFERFIETSNFSTESFPSISNFIYKLISCNITNKQYILRVFTLNPLSRKWICNIFNELQGKGLLNAEVIHQLLDLKDEQEMIWKPIYDGIKYLDLYENRHLTDKILPILIASPKQAVQLVSIFRDLKEIDQLTDEVIDKVERKASHARDIYKALNPLLPDLGPKVNQSIIDFVLNEIGTFSVDHFQSILLGTVPYSKSDAIILNADHLELLFSKKDSFEFIDGIIKKWKEARLVFSSETLTTILSLSPEELRHFSGFLRSLPKDVDPNQFSLFADMLIEKIRHEEKEEVRNFFTVFNQLHRETNTQYNVIRELNYDTEGRFNLLSQVGAILYKKKIVEEPALCQYFLDSQFADTQKARQAFISFCQGNDNWNLNEAKEVLKQFEHSKKSLK